MPRIRNYKKYHRSFFSFAPLIFKEWLMQIKIMEGVEVY
jgi:hypothetical protein